MLSSSTSTRSRVFSRWTLTASVAPCECRTALVTSSLTSRSSVDWVSSSSLVPQARTWAETRLRAMTTRAARRASRKRAWCAGMAWPPGEGECGGGGWGAQLCGRAAWAKCCAWRRACGVARIRRVSWGDVVQVDADRQRGLARARDGGGLGGTRDGEAHERRAVVADRLQGGGVAGDGPDGAATRQGEVVGQGVLAVVAGKGDNHGRAVPAQVTDQVAEPGRPSRVRAG